MAASALKGVDAFLEAALGAWPASWVSRSAFERFLEGRGAEVENAADLYLACACASGHAEALAQFEERLMPAVRAALGRGVGAAELDEAAQLVRERLLVARGKEPPRVADYRGTGPLRGWVRAAAVGAWRNAIRDRHGAAVVAEPGLLEALAGPHHETPELTHMKHLYRGHLTEAVSKAIEGLDAQQRLLLRGRYVDGLTTDQLAVLSGLHRSSVHRALLAAREQLAAACTAELRTRLGVGDSELVQIRRLVQSQLEVTISTLLS